MDLSLSDIPEQESDIPDQDSDIPVQDSDIPDQDSDTRIMTETINTSDIMRNTSEHCDNVSPISGILHFLYFKLSGEPGVVQVYNITQSYFRHLLALGIKS